MSIPVEFRCPISSDIMADPVSCPDGHTYDRSSITTWLTRSPISPITRIPMGLNQIFPNYALRSQIERYLATTSGVATTAVVVPPFKDGAFSIETALHGGALQLRITATEAEERQPIVFLAIIDNSGSMDMEASLAGATETAGFTRLDLVKHAVRTVASVLSDNDMIGVVSFSNSAKIELHPARMTADGKTALYDALDRIRPDSSTNIWEGVRWASVLANDPTLANSNIVALLLTDGLPNINPPRGILPSLQTLPTANQWALHTFGFGYQLDSELLTQLAKWGNGIFGFIPDCSMVGTVIINFMATALSTAVRNVRLEIADASGVRIINAGAIAHGQVRDIVLPVVGPVVVNGTPVTVLEPLDKTIRQSYMTAIQEAITLCKTGRTPAATAVLAACETKLRGSANDTDKAYLRDMRSATEGEGQIGMAPLHFERWGEHYMRSYLSAQDRQQCLNFKDPGLQVYGGALFHSLQDAGDTAFVTLPPPTPSRRVVTSNLYGSAPPLAPVSMAVFHNASGGCFEGQCNVRMADNTTKPISTVNPGDTVFTPAGPATVVARVTCKTANRAQPMTQIGKLSITPWHPIRLSGVWYFPADLASYSDRLCQTVYNLVLDRHHVVNVEGYDCVTLGHNFTEPVVAHPFFGSEAVINDLRLLPGWSVGLPVFDNLVALKDTKTGMINGWINVIPM